MPVTATDYRIAVAHSSDAIRYPRHRAAHRPGHHLLVASLLLCTVPGTKAASFDCSKAAAPVEIAICADPDVSALDSRLGRVYLETRESLVSGEEADMLKHNQRAWLAKRDYRCGPAFTAECLSEWYSRRIAVLELLSSPDFLDLPTGRVAGEYAIDEVMSLHVEALSPQRIAVEIEGAEPTMARWICEFSGVGRVDERGLSQIEDPDSDNVVQIAFSDEAATVHAPDAIMIDYCGRGGTLNGHYVRTATALWAPGVESEGDSEESGDHQDPLSVVRSRAEQGDAAAQNELAGRLAAGDGVPRDTGKALGWYRKAAAQWSPDAMYNLGFTYYYGKGVAKDHAEGMKWLRKASAIGNGHASLEIAELYRDGNGIAADPQRALIWLRKAAYQDDPQAQYRLARHYLDGDGARKNQTEAAHWLRRGAEQDDAESQYALAVMYANGNGVPRDPVQAAMWLDLATSRAEAADDSEGLLETLPRVMTPAQVRKATALADTWRAEHRGRPAGLSPDGEAQPEDPWGQYINGTRYYDGRGVPPDRAEAAHWFHKAAEQDDSASQYYLADMYLSGAGVPTDYLHAYMWLDLATVAPGTAEDKKGLHEKLARLMTTSQIDKAKALADEWRADNRSMSAGSGE